MNKRFGIAAGNNASQWLSPEEFAALSSAEKDLYIFALFALVGGKAVPQSSEQQDASEHSERSRSSS
jgi:hypothetical protein